MERDPGAPKSAARNNSHIRIRPAPIAHLTGFGKSLESRNRHHGLFGHYLLRGVFRPSRSQSEWRVPAIAEVTASIARKLPGAAQVRSNQEQQPRSSRHCVDRKTARHRADIKIITFLIPTNRKTGGSNSSRRRGRDEQVISHNRSHHPGLHLGIAPWNVRQRRHKERGGEVGPAAPSIQPFIESKLFVSALAEAALIVDDRPRFFFGDAAGTNETCRCLPFLHHPEQLAVFPLLVELAVGEVTRARIQDRAGRAIPAPLPWQLKPRCPCPQQ